MSDKLLRCPFCGGETELKKNDFGFYVICPECLCSTQTYSTDDDAISTWNKRPSPWYTGTPTEIKGWFLFKYRAYGKFVYRTVENPVIDIFAEPELEWQKIEED